ncbi:universal stress protein [Aeromicrobium massiliense]|uniref:universal stress protein n=1 Tax=Aeromicrobium massiliense TaxID=1464554 RepID=UPI00030190BA|nr:universal stress protein [Aeromicrobium massiliense]
MSADSHLILVGHDGSSFADDALTWALDLARRSGASVKVLRSWTMATAPRPDTWERGYVPPLSDFGDAVRKALESDTAALRARFDDVPVELDAPHGSAANTLIDASSSANLLVVGPRGLGGFKGLVLGSVSEQCVRHSQCPVVVVRGQIDVAGAERQMHLDSTFED